MALVIGAVEVDAVPAAGGIEVSVCYRTVARAVRVHSRGEEEVGTNAARAGPRREVAGISASARRGILSAEVGIEAAEAGLLLITSVAVLAKEGVSDEHAEALSAMALASVNYLLWRTYRSKGSDPAAVIWWNVVDRHATAGTLEELVGELRDSRKGAVASAEIHVGSPVVGEVLGEGAGRACALRDQIIGQGHARLERVLEGCCQLDPQSEEGDLDSRLQ